LASWEYSSIESAFVLYASMQSKFLNWRQCKLPCAISFFTRKKWHSQKWFAIFSRKVCNSSCIEKFLTICWWRSKIVQNMHSSSSFSSFKEFLCAPLCNHHAYTFHLSKFEQITMKFLVETTLPHHHQSFFQTMQATSLPIH
jgi:hypothetical protein